MKFNLLFWILLLICAEHISAQSTLTGTKKKSKETRSQIGTKKKSKYGKFGKQHIKDKEGKKVNALVKKPALKYGAIRKNGKKLTGSIYSVSGFRICIYSGANRAQAIQIKQDYIKTNSTFKNYISYNRPYYRIKVGDFENKKIAAKELKKIVLTYPNAFIVPDIVTVKRFVVSK